MAWLFRERELEAYRYSHRSTGYVPAYEDRRSRRSRPPVWDDPRRASYTTTYGTYIYPPGGSACGYGPPTPAADRASACSCSCGGRRKSPWTCRRTSLSTDASPAASRTVIDVVDRTGGPLSLRHGGQFPVSLSKHATVDDIISMLAPDRRRHKVVVKWRDGEYEDLDEMIQVDEIRRYATRLDVRERKRVRWV
ncbi:hypothetical protein TOPH_07669 [Tolypocladium ophioglossoides CBS 100239]|uniref:Uncharacterized protein n=1 Tax=Tolypocladium ophioglossoides (strain CBS 100239) TaxID=1163406 RepID=A0A0L0N1N0_TOLOC|nr:hypothetical protein TOPH_07669 [Tolypocladium ophioglossoides CBS 100239]